MSAESSIIEREWILIRGLAREQKHWGAFKKQLQEQDPKSHVRGIDLPGTGDFYRLTSPMTIQGIAEFVHTQLRGPRPKQRYLVAISLGGMVAVELCRLYPESFDGLAIINSSFKNISPVHHRLQLMALPHFYRGLTAKSVTAREREILAMVSNRMDNEETLKEWSEIGRKRPVSTQNFARQLLAAALYELPEAKPSIPVLVMTSTADHMVNPRCSQKLAEKWRAPIEINNSGGHELCLDEPQWVIDQLKKFFKI